MAADPEASPPVQLPEEYSYWNLFQSLFTSDADARAEACKDIVSRLQLAAGATPSDPVSDPEPFLTEQGATLLNFHKYAIARLATECPFSDVRTAFSALLPLIPKVELPRSPSRFVASAQTPAVTPNDPATRQLFEDIFVNSGRVLHLEQLLGWHPRFLSVFSETMDSVMRSDGPLLQPLRHYIALMASSRYSCEYLINVQEQFFLESGGDPTWLQGIKFASPKIQALAELNAFLAHQPWMLRKEHIATLVKGRSADGSPIHHENLWSIAELVHAAVILCTFHSLCGFVFGMGVTPEIEAGSRLACAVYPFESEPTAEEQATNSTSNSDTARLMELLTQSQDGKSADTPASTDASSSFAAVDMDPHTAVTYKDSTLSGPSSSPTSPHARSSERTPEAVSHAERYSGGVPMTYENFDCKSDRYTVFRSHEYSWKEHGIPLLNRFYENMGNLLDTELDLIYDLTYGKVSTTENVDTTPYRRALWYYVSRLYGVSYEDYDYRQVNGFLGIPVKSFVKKVACHPETIAFHDFRNMNITFSVDEKCHVCLLAVESRKQCCLLYALYAIMRFMS